jgi:N-sulfoglucosamine sulfohydrolase
LDIQQNRPKSWEDPKKSFPPSKTGVPKDNRGVTGKLSSYHGKSWLSILGDSTKIHWAEIFASHTFHEIQMYYPMRVIRDDQYKLIWNIAYPLPYPFASDLWAASSFQAQYQKSMSAPYGQKTVRDYIHRPEFEFFKIDQDPNESKNLANSSKHADKLKIYKEKLKSAQSKFHDPWIMKWNYE